MSSKYLFIQRKTFIPLSFGQTFKSQQTCEQNFVREYNPQRMSAQQNCQANMDEGEVNRFTLIDYAVFALMLLVSAGIGFFYAWKERNKKKVDQVLLGGRKLKASKKHNIKLNQSFLFYFFNLMKNRFSRSLCQSWPHSLRLFR